MFRLHPLIGKLLRYDTDNGESYAISRFVADLGEGLYLMQRVSPHTGEDLPASHIVSLLHHADEEWSIVYADMDALNRDAGERPSPVMKLVPPAPITGPKR